MVFANLWMLFAGGGLIAVPIVLHLLMQQRPKPMTFPAVRFLRETFASNQRKLKVKQWLLLLLRILAIVWLALALAQPSVANFVASRWLWSAALLLIALLAGVLLVVVLVVQRPINRILVAALALVLIGTSGGGLIGWLSALGQSSDVTLAAGDGPVAAAFVFDTSPRMGYVQANQTRLEQAVELGSELLEKLPPDSQIAVADTGQSQVYFAVDVAAAKQQLRSTDIDYEGKSLPDQMQELLLLLETSELPVKELYVFTDRSRLAWPEGPSLEAVKSAIQDGKVNLYLVDVRAESMANVRLSSPVLASESLAQQGVLQLDLEVGSDAQPAPATIQMKIERPDPSRPLRRNGETIVPDQYWTREAIIDVPADGIQAVSFQFPDLPTGIHHGVIEYLGTDALDFDNRRYFTVQVRPAWRSLVLTGPDVNDAIVTQAIAPAGERESGRALFDFVVRPQEGISVEPLESFDAVFVMDPGPMTESTWDLLREYVEQGGNVAMLLGANAVRTGDEALGVQTIDPSFVSPSALGLLPGKLTDVWRTRDEGVWLDPVDLTHPLLSPFRGRETTVPWRRFPVQRHWGIQSTPEQETRSQDELDATPLSRSSVVLRYSNGMPAVIDHQLGSGRLFLWTTSVGTLIRPEGRVRWNDLTTGDCWPYFLLINETADALVASSDSRFNYEVGQIASLAREGELEPEQYLLFTPRNEDPQRIQAVDRRWMIRFTETPGHYRLKGDRDGPKSNGFSVNVTASASDLSELPEETWGEWFGESGFQIADNAEAVQRQQGSIRRGTSFYPWLMALLPLLIAIEYLFANRFYGNRRAPVAPAARTRGEAA